MTDMIEDIPGAAEALVGSVDAIESICEIMGDTCGLTFVGNAEAIELIADKMEENSGPTGMLNEAAGDWIEEGLLGTSKIAEAERDADGSIGMMELEGLAGMAEFSVPVPVGWLSVSDTPTEVMVDPVAIAVQGP